MYVSNCIFVMIFLDVSPPDFCSLEWDFWLLNSRHQGRSVTQALVRRQKLHAALVVAGCAVIVFWKRPKTIEEKPHVWISRTVQLQHPILLTLQLTGAEGLPWFEFYLCDISAVSEWHPPDARVRCFAGARPKRLQRNSMDSLDLLKFPSEKVSKDVWPQRLNISRNL